MNDTDLDARLSESAPAASPPLGLAAHRDRIMAEARARRSHRVCLGVASALTSLALIGGGSMAMAGNGGQTPWGWVADNVFSIDRPDGSFCFQGMRVMFDGVSGDSDIGRDARDIVTSIDLDSVDTTAVEARIRADNASTLGLDGKPSPIHETDDRVRLTALTSTVADTLFDGLAERGYSEAEIARVSLESRTTACD